jgi:opacity protein-like surface antigen
MNSFKILAFAGVASFALMTAAQAADVDPPVTEEVAALSGLYLRADAGWSFLDWAGGADDDGAVVGGGIGYRFSDSIRTDLTVDWSGDYTVAPGAELSLTTVMANGYLDWANDTSFTPYVGLGAGYAFVDGGNDGFAIGAAAGVAVDLTNNLAVDVGYRFRDVMAAGDDPFEHQVTAGLRFSF